MGWLLRAIAELYYITLRIEFSGMTEIAPKSLISLWHNRLLLAPLLRKRFPNTPLSIAVSKSRDGMLLSAFVKTYSDVRVIEIGHLSRHMALMELVDELNRGGIVLITPDGPRGPVYKAKPGLNFCVEKTGASVCSFDWTASKTHTFNTWDSMRLASPFSKVNIGVNIGVQT